MVVDRGCIIPDGMVIGEDAAEDARRFYRSEQGITLVTRDMLAALESPANPALTAPAAAPAGSLTPA